MGTVGGICREEIKRDLGYVSSFGGGMKWNFGWFQEVSNWRGLPVEYLLTDGEVFNLVRGYSAA